MFNSNLIFIFSAVLLSCSSVKKMDTENKDFTVISAEKTQWVGGREGVKGWTYSFVLNNNQKQKFHFTNLKVGGNVFPVNVTTKNDSIFISAITTDVRTEPTLDMNTGKILAVKNKSENDGNVLLNYLLSDLKTVRSLSVTNIKMKAQNNSGDALPN